MFYSDEYITYMNVFYLDIHDITYLENTCITVLVLSYLVKLGAVKLGATTKLCSNVN